KYSYIATAHHANDNAETLMMHLFKGTGMAGLHGIPVKNDRIIRPLLFASRKEIETYVATNDIKYREDASNATDNYLRNEVRHHILPVIEKVFPESIRHLRDSIERFAEAEIIYRRAIDAERKKLVEQRGKDIYLPVLKLQKAEALQTICYELFTPYGFTPAQLPSIISLLTAESGHWVGSATHKVIRNRDFLIITDATPHATDIVQVEGVPCEILTEHGTFHFTIEDKPDAIPVAENTAMIDASLLSFPLTLRKWKTGDYFYPLGMGMKKKKVSKYFIDQKVPLHVKDKVWVLESGRRIVWICGMRLDERFKVKDKTQQVIKIVFNQA
ncbi:MAG: tRNA lysidine(34) synthetase TilS, partial [Bacteroidetes bacterium]|nr:tRNA lysidine(34) synthetase TilS [Bacteroidota bacterium]